MSQCVQTTFQKFLEAPRRRVPLDVGYAVGGRVQLFIHRAFNRLVRVEDIPATGIQIVSRVPFFVEVSLGAPNCNKARVRIPTRTYRTISHASLSTSTIVLRSWERHRVSYACLVCQSAGFGFTYVVVGEARGVLRRLLQCQEREGVVVFMFSFHVDRDQQNTLTVCTTRADRRHGCWGGDLVVRFEWRSSNFCGGVLVPLVASSSR